MQNDVRLIDANALRPQNKHLIHDSATQSKRARKHGYYYEPWYKSYRGMFQRCYQEAYEGYEQNGICPYKYDCLYGTKGHFEWRGVQKEE